MPHILFNDHYSLFLMETSIPYVDVHLLHFEFLDMAYSKALLSLDRYTL